MKLFLFSVTMLILSSCASLNLSNCQSGDWENYGLTDATVSHNNNFALYKKQCSEYNISPNKALYDAGFKKGLEELCTFQNGYLIGNEGAGMPRICPKESQDKFIQGFIEGQRNHDQKEQMTKQNILIEKAIDSKKPFKSCQYSSQCGAYEFCSNGQCR